MKNIFPGAKRLFLKKAVELARRYTDEMKVTLEKALESPELEENLKAAMTSSANSPGSSE